jgi:hypothetical protein
MKHIFSFKHAFLGSIIALILGVGTFFITSLYTTSDSISPFQGYADIWLRMIAQECVGGTGPDSCLGPNLGIMIVTVIILGAVIFGFWPRKKIGTDTPQQKV